MSVVFLRARSLFALWSCALALLLLVGSISGCESQIAPPLVEVSDLTPREVEPGDRLEVHGVGFPQGRTGRVVLRGAILRAGQAAIRSATVEASGTVVADRLEILVRDALAERFCGSGDHAVHATFRGDVEVSFASNHPGAAPLVGVLRGTTLDVQPAWAHKASVEAQVAEGGRVLTFMGVIPGAPTGRGLPVERVTPGSLADRAGIRVGDVIAAVDGVHVLSLGDMVPASARAVELTVRAGDSAVEETKTISLVEYAGERVPAEYAPALVIVGLALALLAFLVLPGPTSVNVLEARIASRLRRTTSRTLLASLFGGGKQAAASALLSAIIAAFALTPWVVAPEVDGVLLLLGAGAMLVASRVTGTRGALAKLRVFGPMVLAVLMMVAAMAVAIVKLGAIALAEIVRSQGAAPWDFSAARHPVGAIAAIVYLAAIVAVLRTRPASAAGASPERPEPAPATLFERAGVLLASALAVTVFFGGWQLSGSGSRAMSLVAAGVFVAKTWGVAAALLGASRVLDRHRPRDAVSFVLKRLVPALALAGALAVASRRIAPSLAIETAFGATLVAVTALFAVRVVTRVYATVTRPEPHVSPIL